MAPISGCLALLARLAGPGSRQRLLSQLLGAQEDCSLALAMEGPCDSASGQSPEACEQDQEGRGMEKLEGPLGRG